MVRKLSQADKIRIIAKLESGYTIRQTAEELHINKATVMNVKKRWQNEGTINRKQGTGLTRISSREEDNNLLQYCRDHPFENPRTAVIETNFPGSRRTASRRIKESELGYHVAAKKMLLTQEKKQARLLYALNHINYDPQFWENVVFSDEKSFQSSKNGTIHIYRPRNTRYEERYINNSDRQGRFSVNVWGWISYHDIGMCWEIEGRFNAVNYVNILENVMLPSVQQIYPQNNFIFQHDYSPVHTANIVNQWFQQNNVEQLQWVPKSPDLNPIENVWGEMVKSMLRIRFTNRQQLSEAIENNFELLVQKENYFKNLIHSMPRRLRAVIAANGNLTKY